MDTTVQQQQLATCSNMETNEPPINDIQCEFNLFNVLWFEICVNVTTTCSKSQNSRAQGRRPDSQHSARDHLKHPRTTSLQGIALFLCSPVPVKGGPVLHSGTIQH